MHARTLTFEKKALISGILHVGANLKKNNQKNYNDAKLGCKLNAI